MTDRLIVHCYNTGSVRPAWPTISSARAAHVYLLSETRLTKFGQSRFSRDLFQEQHAAAFGAPLPPFADDPLVAQYGGVACVVAPPFAPRPLYSHSSHWQKLYGTGRCAACFVPINSGRTSFLFVALYGYPSSVGHGGKAGAHRQTTQLAEQLLAVLAQFNSIPVVIGMDLNDDIMDIHPFAAALALGQYHDVGAQCVQGVPGHTYFSAGTSTRIDYCLCNSQAKALLHSFELVPLDQCPAPTSKHALLRVTFEAKLADSDISVLKYRPPLAPSHATLPPALYRTHFARKAPDFWYAIRHQDVSAAWRILSFVFESALLDLQGHDTLPDTPNIRGRGTAPQFERVPYSATVRAVLDPQGAPIPDDALQKPRIDNKQQHYQVTTARVRTLYNLWNRLRAFIVDQVAHHTKFMLSPQPVSLLHRWRIILKAVSALPDDITKTPPFAVFGTLDVWQTYPPPAQLWPADKALLARIARIQNDHAQARWDAYQQATFASWHSRNKRATYSFVRNSGYSVFRPILDPETGQPTTDFTRLHQVLVDAWEPIMSRYRNTPSGDAQPIIDQYGHLLPRRQCSLSDITGAALHAVVTSWRSKSGSADGWDRPTLRKLPLEAFDHIAVLLNTCEQCGHFPDVAHYAAVVLLPKAPKDFPQLQAEAAQGASVDPAPTALQQRPITLQSLLVNMWSTCRFRSMRRWFCSVVHSSCFGGIPHRSTQDIVWDLTLRLEDATKHGRFFGGFSLDSEKFFDNVTWDVIFPLAEYVGFPKPISVLLQSYLSRLNRYFRYGPSAGPYWTCTNSIVQGCAISLILVAIQASLWAYAVLDASPHVTPTSYVDDKQVSGKFPSDVAKAAQASLDVSALLAEKVNVKKSVVFANSKQGQQQLQELLPANFGAPFVTTERVLGAPVVYQGRSPAPISTARLVATVDTIRRVALVPLPFDALAELCAVSALARLYALECRRPTLASFGLLRRQLALSLGYHGTKRCLEAALSFSGVPSHRLDPVQRWVYEVFRTLRRRILSDSSLRAIVAANWSSLVDPPRQGFGILYTLSQAMAFLDLAPLEQPFVFSYRGDTFDLLCGPRKTTLLFFMALARDTVMRRPALDRYEFAGYTRVDYKATTALLRSKALLPMQKKHLRAFLSANIYSCHRLFLMNAIRGEYCPFCNSPRETLHHILYECPCWAEARAMFLSKYPLSYQATFPSCTLHAGHLMLDPAVPDRRLQDVDVTRDAAGAFLTSCMEDSPLGQPLDATPLVRAAHRFVVWTDGSSLFPAYTQLASAGFGVYFAPDHSLNASIRLDGPTQTSARAEVSAVLYCLRTFAFPLEIRTDHEPLVGPFRALSKHWTYDATANDDLWDEIATLLHALPCNHHAVVHVYSHLDEAAVEAGLISEEDRVGNTAADVLAGQASRLNLPADSIVDACRRRIQFVRDLQTLCIDITELRMLADVPYYPGGMTADKKFLLPTFRTMTFDRSTGEPRYTLRPPASEEGVTPVQDVVIPDPTQPDERIVHRTEYHPDDAQPLVVQDVAKWRISRKLSRAQRRPLEEGEMHFAYSSSCLAAVLLWLPQLRALSEAAAGDSSTAQGTTWAELALDFELTTGHPILGPGVHFGGFHSPRDLAMGQRAAAFKRIVGSLLAQLHFPDGTRAKFLQINKSHSLVELGITPIVGIIPRVILASEHRVAEVLYQWSGAAADTLLHVRIASAKCKSKLAKHFLLNKRKAHAGPLAWKPTLVIDPQLEQPILAKLATLVISGTGETRVASSVRHLAQLEAVRVVHNLGARQARKHLILPGNLAYGQPVKCALCTRQSTSFNHYRLQTCARAPSLDYDAALLRRWQLCMGTLPPPQPRTRLGHKMHYSPPRASVPPPSTHARRRLIGRQQLPHMLVPQWKCHTCSLQFCTRFVAIRHIRATHDTVLEHLARIDGHPIALRPLDQCAALQAHLRRTDTFRYVYRCNRCLRLFQAKWIAHQHHNKAHKGKEFLTTRITLDNIEMAFLDDPGPPEGIGKASHGNKQNSRVQIPKPNVSMPYVSTSFPSPGRLSNHASDPFTPPKRPPARSAPVPPPPARLTSSGAASSRQLVAAVPIPSGPAPARPARSSLVASAFQAAARAPDAIRFQSPSPRRVRPRGSPSRPPPPLRIAPPRAIVGQPKSSARHQPYPFAPFRMEQATSDLPACPYDLLPPLHTARQYVDATQLEPRPTSSVGIFSTACRPVAGKYCLSPFVSPRALTTRATRLSLSRPAPYITPLSVHFAPTFLGKDSVHVQHPSQRALQPSEALSNFSSSVGAACVSGALNALQADQDWNPNMTLSPWRETSSRPREPD